MSDKVNDDDCPEGRVEHESVKINFFLHALDTRDCRRVRSSRSFFYYLNKMMRTAVETFFFFYSLTSTLSVG